MGTWGLGAFESDGAADFLDDAISHPAAISTQLLRSVVAAQAIDVDDGQAALAACELVALGFGYGKTEGLHPRILRVAKLLGPNEPLRKLAIAALQRLGSPHASELAGLWHEGDEGDSFDAMLADLSSRLTEAGD